MACMCGGCDDCLMAQGWNPELDAAIEQAEEKIRALAPRLCDDTVGRIAEAWAEAVLEARQAQNDAWTDCLKRIEATYQTREETINGIGGPRVVTLHPLFTDERDVVTLKRLVRHLEGVDLWLD